MHVWFGSAGCAGALLRGMVLLLRHAAFAHMSGPLEFLQTIGEVVYSTTSYYYSTVICHFDTVG